MQVVVSDEIVEQIQSHARLDYPEECCGFLIGATPHEEFSERRIVSSSVPATNTTDKDRRRRFLIPPEELLRMEVALERSDAIVEGFYHSHPDHPALPSEFDEEHAWSWYVYLILSVEQGRPSDLRAFELDAETQRFRSVALSIGSPRDGNGGRVRERAFPVQSIVKGKEP
jgi:proteasome lid subunit RPN8/RPN11